LLLLVLFARPAAVRRGAHVCGLWRLVSHRSSVLAAEDSWMDANRFDIFARAMDGRSRRRLLGVISGGVLTALGAGLDRTEVLAKHHTQPKKPTIKSAYTCAAKANDGIGPGGDRPVGQIFTATRSGELRQIHIGVSKDPNAGPGGDYVIQLLRTTGDPPVPHAEAIDVLAATTIPDADVPAGQSTIVANFAGTRLVRGTVYAVVAARPGAGVVFVVAHSSDVCEGEMTIVPDGATFPDKDAIVSVLVA
jgi:hypothetical protein